MFTLSRLTINFIFLFLPLGCLAMSGGIMILKESESPLEIKSKKIMGLVSGATPSAPKPEPQVSVGGAGTQDGTTKTVSQEPVGGASSPPKPVSQEPVGGASSPTQTKQTDFLLDKLQQYFATPESGNANALEKFLSTAYVSPQTGLLTVKQPTIQDWKSALQDPSSWARKIIALEIINKNEAKISIINNKNITNNNIFKTEDQLSQILKFVPSPPEEVILIQQKIFDFIINTTFDYTILSSGLNIKNNISDNDIANIMVYLKTNPVNLFTIENGNNQYNIDNINNINSIDDNVQVIVQTLVNLIVTNQINMLINQTHDMILDNINMNPSCRDFGLNCS